LNLAGFDLSLTGFGDLELGSLLADKTEGLTDPDDAPPVPEQKGTAPPLPVFRPLSIQRSQACNFPA
jgi:hypothetical protein